MTADDTREATLDTPPAHVQAMIAVAEAHGPIIAQYGDSAAAAAILATTQVFARDIPDDVRAEIAPLLADLLRRYAEVEARGPACEA